MSARVLVVTASKHGATEEIGAEIGSVLEESKLDVTRAAAADVDTLAGWDAVVIGSAVYAGHWLESARRLVEDHAAELEGTPAWLFSSGPVGDPPKPDEDPPEVARHVEATGAKEHRLFPGKIDRGDLGIAERAIVRVVGAEEGDFRDRAAVRAWADRIAETLREPR